MSEELNCNLLIVAGARPNFMKIAPLIKALEKHKQKATKPLTFKVVHTGQHYDQQMSKSFFADLDIPAPDFNLNVGSGSHAVQTGKIMVKFEELLQNHPTNLVVVVGDVNSTMACALVAKKSQIAVAHIEAGLRSFDLAMPEEINRLVTDRLSDLFFTTDPAAEQNLKNEGVSADRIIPVGNVMIDTLFSQLDKASQLNKFVEFKAKGDYALLTLHRPGNVDDKNIFSRLCDIINKLARELRVIFPCHPRTKNKIREFDLSFTSNVTLTEPLPYLEMLNLMSDAKLVFTDSGGLQEETTALGIPCLTLRENTERPITVEMGTNEIVGTNSERIEAVFRQVMSGKGKAGRRPPLWDGKAAPRIVAAIADWL